MTKIKKFLILIVLIIIILIAYSSYVVYQHLKYSLDEVCQMLSSARLPENVYIKEYMCIPDDFEEYNQYIDTYIKNGCCYSKQIINSQEGTFEYITISNQKQSILIDTISKHIQATNNLNNDFSLPTNFHSFFIAVNEHGLYDHRYLYKYCGKEKINGNNCIKVSFKEVYDNKIYLDYYYIDLKTNLILKEEAYNGTSIMNLKKTSTYTYEYYFDVVKDEDILSFDINNYPDYQYYGLF